MVESQPFAGDIYLANLDPTKGGEQAGTRPVIILSLHAFKIRSRQQRLHRKVEAVPKSFIILVRSYVGRLLDLEVPLSDL
jgi:mRNA interferase MazF